MSKTEPLYVCFKHGDPWMAALNEFYLRGKPFVNCAAHCQGPCRTDCPAYPRRLPANWQALLAEKERGQ